LIPRRRGVGGGIEGEHFNLYTFSLR
jgi:hypothetical protein